MGNFSLAITMKNENVRACVLSMLLMAAFVNVSGRARLSYEVAPDTVNHYLEVELTCDNTSERLMCGHA